MYHKLGCGILTVISVLQPAPIILLFSPSPISNQTFFLGGVQQKMLNWKGNFKKPNFYSLSMRHPSLIPPEKELLPAMLIAPRVGTYKNWQRHFLVVLLYLSREPYWRGQQSTVDLLVLTSLVQQFLIVQTLFTFLTKQATLMRRSTVLSLPFQLVFPDLGVPW